MLLLFQHNRILVLCYYMIIDFTTTSKSEAKVTQSEAKVKGDIQKWSKSEAKVKGNIKK